MLPQPTHGSGERLAKGDDMARGTSRFGTLPGAYLTALLHGSFPFQQGEPTADSVHDARRMSEVVREVHTTSVNKRAADRHNVRYFGG